jgi:O-methyltransferase
MMNLKRILFNKYMDRWILERVNPAWHSAYKLLRHGAYDSERVAMYHRAVSWIKENNVQGAFCEFGCYSGESFMNLYFQCRALLRTCPIFYLFDSFQGLPKQDAPDPAPRWKEGDYFYPYEDFLKRMDFFKIPRDAYTAVPGFYDKTLTSSTRALLEIGPMALVHIDCDLYESTLDALAFITPNIQNGTVILFDDYYCWKGVPRRGECGALDYWISRNPRWGVVPWQAYSFNGKAFIVSELKK